MVALAFSTFLSYAKPRGHNGGQGLNHALAWKQSCISAPCILCLTCTNVSDATVTDPIFDTIRHEDQPVWLFGHVTRGMVCDIIVDGKVSTKMLSSQAFASVFELTMEDHNATLMSRSLELEKTATSLFGKAAQTVNIELRVADPKVNAIIQQDGRFMQYMTPSASTRADCCGTQLCWNAPSFMCCSKISHSIIIPRSGDIFVHGTRWSLKFQALVDQDPINLSINFPVTDNSVLSSFYGLPLSQSNPSSLSCSPTVNDYNNNSFRYVAATSGSPSIIQPRAHLIILSVAVIVGVVFTKWLFSPDDDIASPIDDLPGTTGIPNREELVDMIANMNNESHS